MKFIKFILISSIILWTACSGFVSKEKPENLKSKDGKVLLTVPGDWELTEELNDYAVLQAMNSLQEKYAIVLEYKKVDFNQDTLSEFNTYTIDDMFQILKDEAITKQPEKIEVNGLPAVISEFKGDMNGVNICYILLSVEYSSFYYQVLTWTIPSKYKNNHDELMATTLSFKVFPDKFLEEDILDSDNSSEEGLLSNTVYDLDKRMSLTIPAGWIQTNELNDAADIQVFNGGIEGYVIVLSEYKMDFKDVDYLKHSDITREALMDSIVNSEVVKSGDLVDINGKKSVWFTIRGSVSNINIRYTHVTVDGTDMFHQILGWTIPSKEADTQPIIEEIIKSFTEVLN